MSQIVNVEVLYSFALSTGNELLLETTRDQHEGLAVLVDARMSPSIELPPLRDAAHSAIRVSWSEHEESELWEISWFTVRIALTAQRAASANDVVEGIPETTKRAASAAAVRAASHFLRLVRWRCGQFWLPTELKVSGLVYLVEGERVGSQGFLEAGTASRDRALSVNALRVLATDLASGHEPELHEDFLLFAQNYRRQGDLRAAMSFAAISLEASMTKLIRKRLAASAAASSTRLIDLLKT